MYREWRDWESFALFVCQNRINSKLSRNLQIIITIIFFAMLCSVYAVFLLLFIHLVYFWCFFPRFNMFFFLLLTRLHTNVYILIYRCIFAFAVIPIKVLFFLNAFELYIKIHHSLIRSFAGFICRFCFSFPLPHSHLFLFFFPSTTPKSSEN